MSNRAIATALFVAATFQCFAQEGPAPIREVRSMPTGDQGVPHPVGLAFSPNTEQFFLVGASPAGGASETNSFIATMSIEGEPSGSTQLGARIEDPINLTFDSKEQRVLFLNSAASILFSIQVREDGSLDPNTQQPTNVQSWGLGEPQGMGVEPSSGVLFVLDSSGRIVRARPDASGDFSRAEVTVISLAGIGSVDLRGIAVNPTDGNLFLLNVSDQELYELTGEGDFISTRDLSEIAITGPQAIVFAASGDGTDDPSKTTLYVAESGLGAAKLQKAAPEGGGEVIELSLDPVAQAATTDTATLVRSTQTSQWNPPSPDPSGATNFPPTGGLLITDGEVNEMNIFDDANVYKTDLSGNLLSTFSTLDPIDYSDEPTGAAYRESNGFLYISDDTGGDIYEVNPGPDGSHGTADDIVNEFSAPTGSGDPEGIAYDPNQNVLFISDGVDNEIYRLDPGPNGLFGDNDDNESSFDTSSYATDPEGITYNTVDGTLFIVGKPNTSLAEVTVDGDLIRTLDISAANADKPAGLAYAPSSENPAQNNIYIVDRAVDNNNNPNENDGKLYEMSFGGGGTGNAPPSVTITAPSNGSAFVVGDLVTFSGTADDAEDGNIASDLNWQSSINGAIGNGASFGTTALSIGSHSITATVTDSGGTTRSDSIAITVACAGCSMLDIPVGASSDDAEEDDGGSVNLSSSDLELVLAGGNQTVGVRFNGIAIPNGATVNTATIQFTVDETNSDATFLNIHGECSANPQTFQSGNGDVSTRTRTTEVVMWSPNPWLTAGEAGPAQLTPNLNLIVQELMNNCAWTSGSSMAFIITGTGKRVADSYDGDPAGAPRLHVEYSTCATCPSITSVTPTSGPSGGGQLATIDGTNLAGATAVTFGGVAAAIQTNTDTQIDVTIPAGTPGSVDVVVATPGGSDTLPSGYSYLDPPTITSIIPSSGPLAGGQNVTINGANLTAATLVTFGDNPAVISSNTFNQILAITPPGTVGPVDVMVTTSLGTDTAVDGYTYLLDPSLPLYSQSHFRIRSDDSQALNADAGWKAGLDTDATLNAHEKFRVRFEIEETSGTAGNDSFKLQYNKNATGWVDAVGYPDQSPGSAASTPEVWVVTSAQYVDGNPTTDILSGSPAAFIIGEGQENPQVGTIALGSQHTEVEFSIIIPTFYDGPGQNKGGDTFDLRIVKSDGTAFSGTYVSPRVTLTVPPGLIGGTFVESPNRIGPFRDGNGNLYAIIEPAETNNVFMVVKSSDGGVTWAEQDGASRPTTDDVESVDAVLLGDELHAAHHKGNKVVYNVFRVSTHPTNADTYQITDEPIVDSISHVEQSVALEVLSGGRVRCFYARVDGTGHRIFYKTRDGTWGAEQSLDSQLNVSFYGVTGVRGASDKVHIVYFADDGNVYHRSLSSSGTLSDRESLTTEGGVTRSDRIPFMPPVYWDDGGSEKIMVAYKKATDVRVYTRVITNDGVPGVELVASDLAVNNNEGASRQPTANLANDGSRVFLHYADGTTEDVFRDENVSEGGWGVDAEEHDGVEADFIRGFVLTHSAANGGAKVLGYLMDNGSDGFTGTIRYLEYVIPPPPNQGPVLTSLDPPSAPAGGAAITLTANGAGFQEGAVIRWNGVPLTTTFVSENQLTASVGATLIATAASVNVDVQNFDSELSNALPFAINAAPTVSTVNPTSGSEAGGTMVTITGTGFLANATVDFDGAAATGVLVQDQTTITALTPAGTAGAVDVTVTNPDGQTGALTAGYTYTPPAQADVSISKIDDLDPILAGEVLTYTVSVMNSGPDDATDVVVTDTLPAGVTLASTTGCAEDPAGAPTCSLGTIVSGSMASYTVAFTVGGAVSGTITNNVSVSTSSNDPNPIDNATSEDTFVNELPGGGLTTTEARIATSSDDAEERTSGSVRLSSSDLELVADGGGDQIVGLRFAGLGIPQGATIAKSWIQFQVDEATSVGTTLTIRGENVDSAPTFEASSNNISNRTPTSASVPWTPPAWLTVGEADMNQRTPDISTLVQEIVNRPQWLGQNGITFIIEGSGERVAESFNGDAGAAPLLHVEYSGGTPPPPSADLEITKNDSADPIAPGGQLIYTVTVTNHGPDTATDVVVTDTLPAGVTFVSTSGCTEDPSGAPTCSLGPIPSGNSTDYTITVDVDNSTLGVISNQASVTATELDPDTTNDITTQNTLVSDGSEPTIVDIQVTSSTDDAEETAGGNVSTNSSDLELVFDRGGNQKVGLRFPGVAVPAGATILSAYVQFQVDETSTIATSLSIVGEASVNAATFAKTAGNMRLPRTQLGVERAAVLKLGSLRESSKPLTTKENRREETVPYS